MVPWCVMALCVYWFGASFKQINSGVRVTNLRATFLSTSLLKWAGFSSVGGCRVLALPVISCFTCMALEHVWNQECEWDQH